MTRILLIAMFLTLFGQPTWAHKCVLNGNTAAEITAYNSCKNDLATGTAGHEEQNLKQQLLALEKENKLLKNRILMLRERLLNLLRLTD